MKKWISHVVNGRRISEAVDMTPDEEAEFITYRASLPVPKPTRDLEAEIDALKSRLDDLTETQRRTQP